MMSDLSASLGAIQDGRLKIFAVIAPGRVKNLPDVPTIAEAGLPGFAASAWFSVVVPSGTPQSIIDKLNNILVTYMQGSEAQ